MASPDADKSMAVILSSAPHVILSEARDRFRLKAVKPPRKKATMDDEQRLH
jgi:hypothetical protein